MLFGEKYGDRVRMITFDREFSIELCGGCHVPSTGIIGLFKIMSESAVAAGVRRIEAITAETAEAYINDQIRQFSLVRQELKNTPDPIRAIRDMQTEIRDLRNQLEEIELTKASDLKINLLKEVESVNGIQFISKEVNLHDQKLLKSLIFQIGNELKENSFLLFGSREDGKAQLMLYISEDLVKSKKLNAGNIIKELAKSIQGGGGGQPFFATAGGSAPEGLQEALSKAKRFTEN
ncbi:MAG: DHHA1 domain-containing protein, partial [Saprospiraceae bacterium]